MNPSNLAVQPRGVQPKGSMREQMPHCATWFDGLREAFGKAEINAALKRGEFYAAENGHVLGQRQTIDDPSRCFSGDRLVKSLLEEWRK